MSGGGGVSGAASSEGLSGEGGSGSAEWRRMYDRIEALLPRVEALAADRARLEALNRTQRDLSGAREKDLHARLVQAEASRTRWKKAYIDLPLLADPKIIELKEKDSKDSRKRKALFDDDNSVPEIQLRGGRRHVELSETNVGDEDIVRDLMAELTKLKQASETLSTNKDKEAIEVAQKLQQNIEELQVAARKKDDAIARLRVEAVDAKNKLRAMEKDYTALVKMKEVEGAEATEATHKFQNNLEELQVAAGDKDDEIRRLAAEALAAKNNLLVPEGLCRPGRSRLDWANRPGRSQMRRIRPGASRLSVGAWVRWGTRCAAPLLLPARTALSLARARALPFSAFFLSRFSPIFH